MSEMKTPSALQMLKYGLLQYLPGDKGYHYARKYRRGRWQEVDAEFARAQEAARGKVAIDLGGNVGTFAERLAQTASHVYTFEPDPWTAEQLRKNTAHLGNVEVIEAAAGVSAGTAALYRHEAFDTDPEKISQVSSLVPDFEQVDEDKAAAEVEVIDFLEFIRSRNLDIGILKIDIEGSEVPLLEALLEDPLREKIDYIFCETHEYDLPAMRDRYKALRRKAASLTRPSVNLEWL